MYLLTHVRTYLGVYCIYLIICLFIYLNEILLYVYVPYNPLDYIVFLSKKKKKKTNKFHTKLERELMKRFLWIFDKNKYK